MKKFFIAINIILVALIFYLVFSPSDYLTGYVVLEEGRESVVIGSVLYYNITDEQTGKVLGKDYLKDQTIYLTRVGDEIKDASLLKELDSWTLDRDADGEETYCEKNKYENKKYFYDANNNDVKDENEFELYSVYVDKKGCFNVRLPDEMFIAVGLK